MRKNKRRFDPRYFMDEKTDKKVIKEALPKYTQLPEDPDLLQYGDEQRMDQVSKELENQFVQHALVTLNVPDFDGAVDDLDTFITKMGNYVVSGGISREKAKVIIDEIVDAMRVEPRDLSYWEDPEEDYDEDFPLQEMKPGGGEYQDLYSGDYSPRSLGGTDSDLNEKFDTVVDALGQIGEIAHGAVSAVQTEND